MKKKRGAWEKRRNPNKPRPKSTQKAATEEVRWNASFQPPTSPAYTTTEALRLSGPLVHALNSRSVFGRMGVRAILEAQWPFALRCSTSEKSSLDYDPNHHLQLLPGTWVVSRTDYIELGRAVDDDWGRSQDSIFHSYSTSGRMATSTLQILRARP